MLAPLWEPRPRGERECLSPCGSRALAANACGLQTPDRDEGVAPTARCGRRRSHREVWSSPLPQEGILWHRTQSSFSALSPDLESG
jgi:hypothetical protein